jgi:hypothetical protein
LAKFGSRKLQGGPYEEVGHHRKALDSAGPILPFGLIQKITINTSKRFKFFYSGRRNIVSSCRQTISNHLNCFNVTGGETGWNNLDQPKFIVGHTAMQNVEEAACTRNR